MCVGVHVREGRDIQAWDGLEEPAEKHAATHAQPTWRSNGGKGEDDVGERDGSGKE